jgi:hypothetical protein
VNILSHWQQQAEKEIRDRHQNRMHGGSARALPPTQTEQDRSQLLSLLDDERKARVEGEERLYEAVCQLLAKNPWILIRRSEERAELDRRERGEFKRGDRVRVLDPGHSRLDGMTGVVVSVDFEGRPMVRLDQGWDTGAYGLDPGLLELL